MIISFWLLIVGVLIWLIIKHPIKHSQKDKDNYGYFFNNKNKKEEK